MATAPQTPQQQKEEAERKAREAEAARKAKEEADKKKAGSRPAGSVVSPGAASTSNMGASIPPMVDPRGDRFFTMDEISALAGDLQPGEIGWVKLDENGTPTGAAVRESPFLGGDTAGETWARVVGTTTRKYDEIVTPSGAPVTRFMNPDPVLWDDGMLARNPIPAETEQSKQYKVPAGAPVVNQPVAT
jgi:hypothetical protein